MSRPFRYTFILGLVALATALSALGGWRYARASAPVNGPIVLISVDALRADHLPAFGYRQIRTPAIDALAADGIAFERAYSPSPQTLPAHVSLLTGRLPFETGVRDEAGFTLKDDERTLAEILRDRGFATGGVVSSYALRKETGIDQGFSFFDSDLPAADDEAARGVWRSGDRSAQIAEQWLDKANTSRLFLFLHLDEPHQPDALADADRDTYDLGIIRADQVVGGLIRYLKAHQLYDQSTIILVSDHGQGLGDHGEQTHGLFVYEEALRVPLIIKQAAAEGAGRRVTDLVQLVDLVPTVLDLAKAPSSGNLSGRSLKPLLDGSGHFGPRTIYAESLYARYHFGWSELTSITDGRYRYIRAPREELYDLQNDPTQQHNLAAAPPGEIPPVIDGLRHDLKRFGANLPVPSQVPVPLEDQERLGAVGVVGSRPPGAQDPDLSGIDPKDKVAIVETYRDAVRIGLNRQWAPAIDLLRAALVDEPARADLWTQLATFAVRAGRDDQAQAAYKRILVLNPTDGDAHLGAAAALLRLRRVDEARVEAAAVARAPLAFSDQQQAAAHALLAEVALVRRDADLAREEAILARDADSRLPMTDYVEARLLYDSGRIAGALPYFENAVAALKATPGARIQDLHYYTGDVYNRLKRYADAEPEFIEELVAFPLASRARIALATLYRKTGRADEADQALDALLRISPTAESYRLAARLWETFGDSRRAASVRADARRLFAPAPGRSSTAQ